MYGKYCYLTLTASEKAVKLLINKKTCYLLISLGIFPSFFLYMYITIIIQISLVCNVVLNKFLLPQ